MSSLYERIEQRLHRRINQLRKDSGRDLPEDLFDPVFTHLSKLIDVVAGIEDYSTEPYLEKVRAVVCVECSQNPSGQCVRRDAGMCGLNDYFPLVVGTIEQELKADPGLES
jgi:hypothetical protein